MDGVVKPDESERLESKLKQAGVKHLFVRMPWATHGCDKSFGGPCGQVATYAVERFLDGVMASSDPKPEPRNAKSRCAWPSSAELQLRVSRQRRAAKAARCLLELQQRQTRSLQLRVQGRNVDGPDGRPSRHHARGVAFAAVRRVQRVRRGRNVGGLHRVHHPAQLLANTPQRIGRLRCRGRTATAATATSSSRRAPCALQLRRASYRTRRTPP